MAREWLVGTGLDPTWDFYTRANVGEVFPDPVAPLSFTYFQNEDGLGAAEHGFRDAFVRIGSHDRREFADDHPVFLGVMGGYCYLNASLMRMLGHRAPDMTAEDIDASFFGDAPGVPPFVVQPGYDRPDLTAKVAATVEWAFTTPDLPQVAAHEQLVNDLRDARPDVASLCDGELVERPMDLLDTHFRSLFGEHIFVTFVASIPFGALQHLCTAVGRPEATLALAAGVGDVESAAPSMAMWDLGREVAASRALRDAFTEGAAGLDGRLRAAVHPDIVRFVKGFDDFLYHYGSRGPNEWETRCPTWETDPDLALAAIDRMRLADGTASPWVNNAKRADEREALIAEIAALLEGDQAAQGQFLAAARATALFMAGRERTKTNCVKLIEEARVCLHEYGRRRHAEGHFPTRTSYAMLGRSELLDSVDHPERYTQLLREREALFVEVSGLQEPFIVVGEEPDIAEYPTRDSVHYERLRAGEHLAAVPGCPGTARGIARVVLDSHDPTALAPGDVLVAPITDPSWTPLFVPAAAVVVDVGAPLSHAIIVSRELGIPCVVSALAATKRIPDGALVEVDGTTGGVTVIDVP